MDNTELDLRRTIAAAERARALIEDPLLVAAFEALEARVLLGWRSTDPTDTAGREALWHHFQALGEVRAQLETVLNDGLMARSALDEMRASGTATP